MGETINMSETEHDRVTKAVRAAEAGTSGEIVTIIADASDHYLDTALWWAVVAALISLALLAACPATATWIVESLSGGWVTEIGAVEYFELALAAFVITFGIIRLILQIPRLRIALTFPRVKSKRVRNRAIDLFKVGAESRTAGRTGILIYLSLAEHRAEIVADEAVHKQVSNDMWGAAMADLIGHVREERITDGMVAAVNDVGKILTQYLPRKDDDINELPDRLIEL